MHKNVCKIYICYTFFFNILFILIISNIKVNFLHINKCICLFLLKNYQNFFIHLVNKIILHTRHTNIDNYVQSIKTELVAFSH